MPMRRLGGLFKSQYGSAMVMRKQLFMNEHGYISKMLSRKEAEYVMAPSNLTCTFYLDMIKCIQKALLRSSCSSGASSFSVNS